jgi:hypothetical protein
MKYEGDGRYVCPNGCGEFLRREQPDDAPKEPKVGHVSQSWPELVKGTAGALRQAMQAVATMPLGTADVTGPCRGHGGKGGSKSGGGKSPARQKYEAWQRKMGPGRIARSVRTGR